MRNSRSVARYARAVFVAVFGFSLALTLQAQRPKKAGVKVTGVASRTTGRNAVVSISADGSLTNAQTWQDKQGFHIVLPEGQTATGEATPRGVKVQRVGNSLEFIVPVKPGASVTVQPRFNRLDLVVDGGIEEPRTEQTPHAGAVKASPRASRLAPERARQQQTADERAARARGADTFRSQSAAREGSPETIGRDKNQEPGAGSPVVVAQGVAPAAAQNAVAAPSPSIEPPSDAPAGSEGAAGGPGAHEPQKTDGQTAGNEGTTGSTIWATLFLLSLGVSGALLLFMRHRGGGAAKENGRAGELTAAKIMDAVEQQQLEKAGARKGAERRKGGAQTEATRGAPAAVARPPRRKEKTSGPAVLFGAYRIDQEVGKLVSGLPHSIDVIASRATDDRRAVETSLVKALQSQDEDVRRRARAALDEYGFVARQSAALLLGGEAYERAAAARTLGEIRSPSALPFLLEALYDQEPVVRAEAVTSLGALGLPAAIGALLDMARRHPEIPASLIGPALSACSVDSVEASWGSLRQSRVLELGGASEQFTGEITGLEPVAVAEELPLTVDDDALMYALEQSESADREVRVAAAHTLGQFPVRCAVEVLTVLATRDPEASVRSSAVTSLGQIDHETVFAPMLVAMADEAREVRAAAARGLACLNFDRADAYVRAIETSDAETLQSVAQACIKAGLTGQALDRLASQDRRQAYEAFALLSLVVRAGELKPLLEAIESHRDTEISLAALRLLTMVGRPAELAEPLRQIAIRGGVPEKVRAAIMEAVYKVDEAEAQVV